METWPSITCRKKTWWLWCCTMERWRPQPGNTVLQLWNVCIIWMYYWGWCDPWHFLILPRSPPRSLGRFIIVLGELYYYVFKVSRANEDLFTLHLKICTLIITRVFMGKDFFLVFCREGDVCDLGNFQVSKLVMNSVHMSYMSSSWYDWFSSFRETTYYGFDSLCPC